MEREWRDGMSFGEVLAGLAPARGGVIVLSGGAVPLAAASRCRASWWPPPASGSARRSPTTATRRTCAQSPSARVLSTLPPLPSDNALPRWLEEHAGYAVSELRARDRLGIDLDTPSRHRPRRAVAASRRAWLRHAARQADGWSCRAWRSCAPSPATLTASSSSSAGAARGRCAGWSAMSAAGCASWPRSAGLRASSPLAINAGRQSHRHKTGRGQHSACCLISAAHLRWRKSSHQLGDGAIIDSRVLLAHRLGADESRWPSPADRFASDLLRPSEVGDPWLRELTESAAESRLPVLLGGHSLVGPGIPLLLVSSRSVCARGVPSRPFARRSASLWAGA